MYVRFWAPWQYFAYHHMCTCENMGHDFKMPVITSTIYLNIRAKSENLSWVIFMKVDSTSNKGQYLWNFREISVRSVGAYRI